MDKIDNRQHERRWLFAAMAVACFYSVLALHQAFRLPNLVADDARQHVFWMQRFVDPALFPNDLIADYFQAVAPAGYKFFYWIFAKVGIEPLLLSKILPTAIGILTAYLAFKLFVQWMSDARGAFFASVLLGQLIWLKDDVSSATPRAFVYPLFLAFMLLLLRRSFIACLLVLALEGLIYPQAAFVSAGILCARLLVMKDRHLHLSRNRRDYVIAFAGVITVAAVLLPFASAISKYGPVITRESARALPEFLRHGRSQFFTNNNFSFWFLDARSGLLPNAIPAHILALALGGSWLLFCSAKISSLERTLLFGQIAAAAISMWSAAHLFLFRLHLPARYSQWVFRILLAMIAAIALIAIWDFVRRWRRFAWVAQCFIVAAVIIAPNLMGTFPANYYLQPKSPSLYQFLRTRPTSSVIATLKDEADMIPTMAHRSVLVSAEYAVPYHQGFYRTFRERGQALLRAFKTSRPEELRDFIEKYHVDLIIVGHGSARAAEDMRWYREIAVGDPPSAHSALSDLVEQTKIWENENNIVLDARVIAQAIPHD